MPSISVRDPINLLQTHLKTIDDARELWRLHAGVATCIAFNQPEDCDPDTIEDDVMFTVIHEHVPHLDVESPEAARQTILAMVSDAMNENTGHAMLAQVWPALVGV